MHSKPYYDLVQSQINANITGISNFAIAQATPVTLNRPVIITDSSSLVAAVNSPAAKNVTFGHCAEDYVAHMLKKWEPKTARQTKSLIRDYLNPTLGHLPIAAITHHQCHEALKTIWETKHQTAVVARIRLEGILARATARGCRTGDNPASMNGPLGILLHDTREIHTVKHHDSLPYQEIGAFMAKLRAYRAENQPRNISVPGKLLEFVILTAVRQSEAQFMCWSEIDWDSQVWTCPWQRIKTGKKTKKDHLVPLSDQAVA